MFYWTTLSSRSQTTLSLFSLDSKSDLKVVKRLTDLESFLSNGALCAERLTYCLSLLWTAQVIVELSCEIRILSPRSRKKFHFNQKVVKRYAQNFLSQDFQESRFLASLNLNILWFDEFSLIHL